MNDIKDLEKQIEEKLIDIFKLTIELNNKQKYIATVNLLSNTLVFARVKLPYANLGAASEIIQLDLYYKGLFVPASALEQLNDYEKKPHVPFHHQNRFHKMPIENNLVQSLQLYISNHHKSVN